MSLIKDISTDQQNFEQVKKDWEAFRQENPHIYLIFDQEVRKDIQYLYDKGLLWFKTVRIRKIFETIKWKGVTTSRPDGYTINNNFYKYYCLLWECRNPKYAGIFEHRGYIPAIVNELILKNQHKKDRAKKRYKKIISKPRRPVKIN